MLLLQHEMVIFYNHNRVIDATEHEALMDYLELGGTLVVTGFDSLGAPDDPLMAEVVRSASVGDNMGEGTFTVTDSQHPIMNGIFGRFSSGSSFSISETDHDNAEADVSKNARTIADLNDGYDKVMSTELSSGGKVIYWNGNRNCDDWTTSETENMFKNLIVWIMPIYEDVGFLTSQIPSVIFVNETADIMATVINLGLNDSAGFDVSLEVRDSFGFTLLSQIRTVNPLSHLQTSDISWQWMTHLSGQYFVNITLMVTNDEIPGNNLISRQFIVYYKLFEDDMESGTNSWTASSSIPSPLWHQSSTESYSPTTSWWCGMDSSTQYTVLSEQYLTSPVIDLVDAKEAYLSFYHKISIDDYLPGGDWGFVEINPDGNGWTTLDSYSVFNLGWNQINLDLTTYLGSFIQIRFHLGSQVVLTDNGWWVDDVLIFGFADQYGIELSGDINSATAGKNEFAYYEISVKNTGNTVSDFNLNISGSGTQNWQFSFNPETFSLLPWEIMLVNLSLMPLQTQAGDYVFSVIGQAESGGIPKAQDSLDRIITAEPYYGVDIIILPPLLFLIPGETKDVTIFVNNNGNIFDTISLETEYLELGVSNSWLVQIEQEFLGLDPFESENVTLTIFAPLDGVMDDYLVVNVTASSFGNPNENAKHFTVAQIREFYSLEISTSQTVKETKPKIPVEYYIEVSNRGNSPVTVNMDVSPIGNWEGWTGLFNDVSFMIDAYSVKNITLTITSPNDLLENEFKEFDIQASSAYNLSLISVKTVIGRTGDINIFVDENEQNAKMGEMIFYKFTVSNTQNANDTIDVRASSRNGWQVALFQWDGETALEDSDSDNKPDTGFMESFDGSKDIVVGVEIPLDATVLMEDKILVTFTSSLSNGSVISLNVKAITDPSGGATIEAVSYSESAASGSLINYWITIKNFFNYETELDITLTSKYDWEMELYFGDASSTLSDSNNNGILDTGELEALGGTADIMIILHVPEDALAFTENIVTVLVSSSDYNGGQKSIALNATVKRIYDFEIEFTEKNNLQVISGKELDFEILILNYGNYEEDLDLRFGELPFGWRGYFSNNEPLVPIGSSKQVTVTLEIPQDTEAGDYVVFIKGITSDEVQSQDLSVSVQVMEKEEGIQLSFILLLLLFVVIIILLAAVTLRKRDKKVEGTSSYPAQYPVRTSSQYVPNTQEKYASQYPIKVEYPSQSPLQTNYSSRGYSAPVFPSFETIKCPACYSAFEIEKGIRPARVQCPRCGVTGTIR
jgi:uncharacterized membrane protein